MRTRLFSPWLILFFWARTLLACRTSRGWYYCDPNSCCKELTRGPNKGATLRCGRGPMDPCLMEKPSSTTPTPSTTTAPPATEVTPEEPSRDYCTMSPEFTLCNLSFKKVSFWRGCREHDACYDACGKRERCDKDFRDNLYEQCDSTCPEGFQRNSCRQDADVYYAAVKNFGGFFYPDKCTETEDHCTMSPEHTLCNLSFKKVNFWRGCKAHDACYDACEGKAKCDGDFRKDLYKECDTTCPAGFQRWSCRRDADIYFGAVNAFGDFFYPEKCRPRDGCRKGWYGCEPNSCCKEVTKGPNKGAQMRCGRKPLDPCFLDKPTTTTLPPELGYFSDPSVLPKLHASTILTAQPYIRPFTAVYEAGFEDGAKEGNGFSHSGVVVKTKEPINGVDTFIIEKDKGLGERFGTGSDTIVRPATDLGEGWRPVEGEEVPRAANPDITIGELIAAGGPVYGGGGILQSIFGASRLTGALSTANCHFAQNDIMDLAVDGYEASWLTEALTDTPEETAARKAAMERLRETRQMAEKAKEG